MKYTPSAYAEWIDPAELEKKDAMIKELTAKNDGLLQELYGRDVEIERLTAENERLRAALRPFAELVPAYGSLDGKLFRQAAEALAPDTADVCDKCDRPAYQWLIDGARYCKEHQVNVDELTGTEEME